MPKTDERAGLSGGARWAIAVAAVVVLIVAFLALRGGSGDESDEASTPPAATQPGQLQQQTPTPQQATTQAEAPPAPTPLIRVRGGKPVGGVEKLRVHKGERLRFAVVSDAPGEVHLHGYDVEKELTPGKRVTFDVKATIEGRFEVELHGTDAQLAQVDVTP
jgi:hypothetical protein